MPSFSSRWTKPIAVLVAVVLLWLVAKIAFRAYWLAGVVLLLVGTWWLVRPEWRAVFGAAGDARPWLVRLREHRLQPVWLPGGYRAPRLVAYCAVVIAWYCWL